MEVHPARYGSEKFPIEMSILPYQNHQNPSADRLTRSIGPALAKTASSLPKSISFHALSNPLKSPQNTQNEALLQEKIPQGPPKRRFLRLT